MQEYDIARTIAVIKRTLRVCRPAEFDNVVDWAENKRFLTSETSAETGRYSVSRTPYMYEIMRAFTDPLVSDITIAASAQTAKTTAITNMILYAIDSDPYNIMFGFPTEKDADRFSKTQLTPAIQSCKGLRAKIRGEEGRTNTILQKSYPGGTLKLVGVQVAADLASTPCRYIFGDEIDRWTKSTEQEGDPWGLLTARTATFFNAKRVKASTPTVRGASAIEAAYNLGTMEQWCYACPACGEFHPICFNDIKFGQEVYLADGVRRKRLTDAPLYRCPDCGAMAGEFEMKNSAAKWIKRNEKADGRHRSFWINGFSSPWMHWDEMCQAYLDAGDDYNTKQVVYNTKFGELWEMREHTYDPNTFMGSQEDYGAELPSGVLYLTCGVDVQADRLEYEVLGHGRGQQTYGIRYGVIHGQTNLTRVWEELERDVIDRAFTYATGEKLKIGCTFVDSGAYTATVYKQCYRMQFKHVFPIKGKPSINDENVYIQKYFSAKFTDETNPITVRGLIVNVDYGKQEIYSRMLVQDRKGYKYCHFPSGEFGGYTEQWYAGLMTEYPKQNEKTGKWGWEKIPGARNEPLDCRNYALAAFAYSRVNVEQLVSEKKPAKPKQKQLTTQKSYGRFADKYNGEW